MTYLKSWVDSRGRIWDLKKEWSKDSMPGLDEILEFIKEPFFKRRRDLRDDERWFH